MATEYIPSTVPAKVVWVSHTTLFQVALEELGDPLRWVEIARLNGLSDPWVTPLTQILIPPVLSTAPVTGILGL